MSDAGEERAAGDERARRLALNEALSRDVNELVDEVASGWFEPHELVEFRCECSRSECTERVALTREEYATLRENALTFVVVAGHETPDIEDVVAHIREYPIARKRGEPGIAVAEATDPRAGA